ncbi:EAL domain-containing protein [Vibrio scophthalmi]|uniref:Diguanylate cyclase DosC n=1 Tax=Vibrio scophthalmi TaxID=45658 RepID=A0A1C7FD10_9VIBR|nr:EAL domain-containing protein [Vibrio scophthalmi]ANU37812.1 Diguanylate cyclase DosC [Vibrio scophthalmi]
MPATTQISLKTAVILPFVLIFLFTIGVITAVQNNSYEEMVSDISRSQLNTLSDNVRLELDSFLNRPFQASVALRHTIESNQLYSSDDLSAMQNVMFANFQALYSDIPQLDNIGFGGEGGEYVGLRKEDAEHYSLMLQDHRTDNTLIIFKDHQPSNNIRSVIADYDPRERPWYTAVANNRRTHWSSIYTNADERQEITLSAISPVWYQQAFQGVVVSDIKLETFNVFLRNQQQKTAAIIYLFDEQQRLVAHSEEGSIVSWGTELSQQGQRLLAQESNNPVIKATAHYVSHRTLPTEANYLTNNVLGERYFKYITPYHDQYGLKWYIGVAISEHALLGTMPEAQQHSWIIALIISTLGIILGLITFNRVVTPITSTATAAKQLSTGDWDSELPKAGHVYETTMLVQAFNEMTDNLKISFHKIQSQLLYDSLTKLYSREGLVDTCDKIGPMNGCLLLIGINKFREINDSMGHIRGDQLLVIIAERLKSAFDDHVLIARIGGDEFALYLTEPQSQEAISQAISRIQQIFSAPYTIEKESVLIQVSLGIVTAVKSDNMTLWLRNGSIALSNAKQDQTMFSHYKPEMADISRKRTQMHAKMKEALEQDEFVPFYQPIVDLNTGKIIGAEALARWISPTEGLISPLDFIPIAEESGFISAIGKQILTQACNDTVRGIKESKWDENFHLHVNLSVNQLSQHDLIAMLKQILTSSGLAANNLTLEITESRLVDNDPMTIENMQAIRDLGIHIAIDDFGTGYSSLAYLHKLPFDCLKIDRVFVNKLNQEQLDNSIVAAIINMMRGMKVELVAEGIETIEQAELLKQLHCPQGQGFLYSRPLPYDEWPTDLVNMK